ncbi:histidinol-phosphate phosphatase family protein [Parvibaculum lavamentivorans DS-1]|uniref:D,D-heptose 1,7-bisphosphate phosphatase n=1 Tax=Parvibaculum lavamentivorans (strain DS-1 / DSM 13023 / NCIMB 13966) TaxID=402881 RepID=A7HUC6_PARL1|nr:HAD-IIIA family hydrolase [Parvibaculum lavamentivorans]ABS63509.1 histidinol-phosphate phosphatase family protein [Parvibaculum lavamentivorans DS-1]
MLTQDGIWLSTGDEPSGKGAPALFLDRDGVLVKEVNYLKNKEDVALEAGAAEIINWAKGWPREYAAICVTNQSGIARGLVSWPEFEAVEAEITRQLAGKGAALDLTIACPFHPDFTPGYGSAEDAWRKPGCRMLEYAAERLGLDLAASWLIGDKAADIEAAKRAGLKGALLVLTGYGAREREAALALAGGTFKVAVLPDLIEARGFLDSAF